MKPVEFHRISLGMEEFPALMAGCKDFPVNRDFHAGTSVQGAKTAHCCAFDSFSLLDMFDICLQSDAVTFLHRVADRTDGNR